MFNYPPFRKEWLDYRQTYHAMVSDDLREVILREKCVSGDAVKMIGHLDDLGEIWEHNIKYPAVRGQILNWPEQWDIPASS